MGCIKTYEEPVATLDRYWDTIVQYMDIFYRNQVHQELAPCTNLKFLRRYCELDAGFDNLIKAEFPSEIYWLI